MSNQEQNEKKPATPKYYRNTIDLVKSVMYRYDALNSVVPSDLRDLIHTIELLEAENAKLGQVTRKLIYASDFLDQLEVESITDDSDELAERITKQKSELYQRIKAARRWVGMKDPIADQFYRATDPA